MTKKHVHVVFINEGDDTFSIAETGGLKDHAAAKAWMATNGKPDVAYRTGTILMKDIRV